MSDFISRKALCDDLREYKVHPVPISSDESEVKGYNDGIDLAISVIAEFPSAEPERKKGKWIPVDSYNAFGGDEATWMAHGNPVAFYYCSECKEQAYAGEDGQSLITDYCPNCGAEMSRGE